MHYVLSFDAESTAQAIDAWVPAVGLCLVDASGNVVMKRRWHIAPCAHDTTSHVSGYPQLVDCRIRQDLVPYFDSYTYTKFWSNFVDVFLEFQSSMQAPEEAWAEIHSVIQDVYTFSGSVVLGSDCPDFDTTAFNTKLKLFANHHLGIRYTADGTKRHPITNPVEVLKFVQPKVSAAINKKARHTQPHDHRPENDAHYTAIQILELWKLRQH